MNIYNKFNKFIKEYLSNYKYVMIFNLTNKQYLKFFINFFMFFVKLLIILLFGIFIYLLGWIFLLFKNF